MIMGNTIAMAHKSLDYLWKKQELTLTNIANVDTPNYKKKYISFEEQYRNKLRAASQVKDSGAMRQAIQSADYLTYTRSDSARLDENNVNIDVENTELARTTLHYQYLLQSISSDITRYRSAIKGQ